MLWRPSWPQCNVNSPRSSIPTCGEIFEVQLHLSWREAKTLRGVRGATQTKWRHKKHCALSCRNGCCWAFLLLASRTNNAYYYDCCMNSEKYFLRCAGEFLATACHVRERHRLLLDRVQQRVTLFMVVTWKSRYSKSNNISFKCYLRLRIQSLECLPRCPWCFCAVFISFVRISERRMGSPN